MNRSTIRLLEHDIFNFLILPCRLREAEWEIMLRRVRCWVFLKHHALGIGRTSLNESPGRLTLDRNLLPLRSPRVRIDHALQNGILSDRRNIVVIWRKKFSSIILCSAWLPVVVRGGVILRCSSRSQPTWLWCWLRSGGRLLGAVSSRVTRIHTRGTRAY